MKYIKQITKDSILLQFGKYVSFNVLGMIGISCYILSDTFFVAKGLGANGLAALNLAIPIYNVINGIGLMLGMGGGTRYSIHRGGGDQREGNRAFSQAFAAAIGISLLLALTGILFSKPISTLLGADTAVLTMTNIYIKIILMFSPMYMMNNVLLCFIRNDGNPKLSMTAMIAGSFSNIALDYIFVILMKMGLFGAALSTGIAPVISMLILSYHFISKKNKFIFVKVKLELKYLKGLCAIGISSFISELSSGIVMVIFNIIILKLQGNVGVAAYGVVANLSLVFISLFTGVAQGVQPIISDNYGREHLHKVKKAFQYAVVSSVVMAIVIYTLTFCYSEAIVGVFNEERNATMEIIAIHGLRLYFTALIFAGLNIVTAVFFSSIDKPMEAFILSILRGFAIIIPLAFIMASLWGMTGVWIALPFTEGITLVIAGVFLKKKKIFRRSRT